jgi:hypothetical protein
MCSVADVVFRYPSEHLGMRKINVLFVQSVILKHEFLRNVSALV